MRERDAALRDDASTLSSTSSTPSRSTVAPSPTPPLHPFFTAFDELPPELREHKDRIAICGVLKAEPDPSMEAWQGCTLYTPENHDEWLEWQSPSKVHRDAKAAGDEFSKKCVILSAPGLGATGDAAADAWDEHRGTLLILLRAALVVGFSWKDLLWRWSRTLYHQTGYARLENYVSIALSDKVLIKYPLLHVSVLIFTLDASYARCSPKYDRPTTSVAWDECTERRAGEDVVSLALRVLHAFLKKMADPRLTETNYADSKSYMFEVHERYAACLKNDVNCPERGVELHMCYVLEFNRIMMKVQMNEATNADLRLLPIADEVALRESACHSQWAEVDAAETAAERADRRGLTQGRGAAARRTDARAHLQRPLTFDELNGVVRE